jgi:hypothetical protein
MSITEHLKGVQDMKKLQVELIVAQNPEAGETGADGTSPRASSGDYSSWRRKIRTWCKHRQSAQK